MTLIAALVTAATSEFVHVRAEANTDSAVIRELKAGDTIHYNPAFQIGGPYIVGGKMRSDWYALDVGFVACGVVTVKAVLSAPAEIIDVSQENGLINWTLVAASGVKLAIIRASQGVEEDTSFQFNMTQALGHHLAVHTYHAFLPNVDVEQQAELYLSLIKPYPASMAFVDVERSNGVDKETLADLLKTLLQRLTVPSLLVGIYTSPGVWAKIVGVQNDAYFSKFPLWLAEYNHADQPDLPHGFTNWILWQYSDHGAVPGTKGVDLSRAHP